MAGADSQNKLKMCLIVSAHSCEKPSSVLFSNLYYLQSWQWYIDVHKQNWTDVLFCYYAALPISSRSSKTKIALQHCHNSVWYYTLVMQTMLYTDSKSLCSLSPPLPSLALKEKINVLSSFAGQIRRRACFSFFSSLSNSHTPFPTGRWMLRLEVMMLHVWHCSILLILTFLSWLLASGTHGFMSLTGYQWQVIATGCITFH